jgi:hypothetical protein
MNFLYVALGGALGAMARYAISLIPVNDKIFACRNNIPSVHPRTVIYNKK